MGRYRPVDDTPQCRHEGAAYTRGWMEVDRFILIQLDCGSPFPLRARIDLCRCRLRSSTEELTGSKFSFTMATVDPSTVLQLISLQLRHNRVRNRLQVTRRRMRSRRKALFLLCTTSVLLLCADLIPNPRSVWMHTRSTRWWEDVLSHFGPHDWMEYFRMTQETFQYLCNQLRLLKQM